MDEKLFADEIQALDLFPCVYFVSKSIFFRKLFIQAKYEAFAGTPLQKRFRTYSFRQYKIDQNILEKVIREELQKYFFRNAAIKTSVYK